MSSSPVTPRTFTTARRAAEPRRMTVTASGCISTTWGPSSRIGGTWLNRTSWRPT
ncbi:MAG: hypothetical protein ACKOTZ_13610 [Chloroflexota bacterium]